MSRASFSPASAERIFFAAALIGIVATWGALQVRWEFVAYYAIGGLVLPLLWPGRDRLQTTVLAGAAPVLVALLYPVGWVNPMTVVHLTSVGVAALLVGKWLAARIRSHRSGHAV